LAEGPPQAARGGKRGGDEEAGLNSSAAGGRTGDWAEGQMRLTIVRALLAAAFSTAMIYSTTASATTYDLTLDSILGGKVDGTGTLVVDNSGKVTELEITLDLPGKMSPEVTFDFSKATAIFNKSGKLVDLIGFDLSSGDSLSLAFLGGIFFDSKNPRDNAVEEIFATLDSRDPPNPTPLPTTWSMMLMGLIGLGALAYTRRRDRPSCLPA
jgi:hypothetical protein